MLILRVFTYVSDDTDKLIHALIQWLKFCWRGFKSAKLLSTFNFIIFHCTKLLIWRTKILKYLILYFWSQCILYAPSIYTSAAFYINSDTRKIVQLKLLNKWHSCGFWSLTIVILYRWYVTAIILPFNCRRKSWWHKLMSYAKR